MDRVNEVTREVFNALAQIRRADERSNPMPDVLHGRMRSFAEGAMRRAGELGFTQQDCQDIGYVLVALIDEVVVAKGGELRDFWLPRLLQLHFFNENIAGEGVFNRLQMLVGDPSRVDVLRVYYLCLLFGFQGKYRVRGGEIGLGDETDRVADALRRNGIIREVQLSPEGDRPKERGGGVRRSLPLVAISLGTVVFALLVYFGLMFTIGIYGNSVADTTQQATNATQ